MCLEALGELNMDSQSPEHQGEDKMVQKPMASQNKRGTNQEGSLEEAISPPDLRDVRSWKLGKGTLEEA